MFFFVSLEILIKHFSSKCEHESIVSFNSSRILIAALSVFRVCISFRRFISTWNYCSIPLSRSIPRARRFGSSTWRASIIPQSSIPHSLTLTQSHRHRIRSLVNINECAMKRFLFDFIKQSHCDLFASFGSPFKMHRSFDSLHTEYQPKKHR